MLNMAINNINEIKAYENILNNEQYLEIIYKDLDNVTKSLLYSPNHNQFDDTTNDTEYNVSFGTLIPLFYDILDYSDARNEFYKIIYRYSLEVNKRGYYFTEITDRGNSMRVSVNSKSLSESMHIGGDSKFKVMTKPDGDYYALDDNNNRILIDPNSVQLYKTISFNTSNVICDLQKSFEMSVIQMPNIRFIRDYNAKIKNSSILVRTDTPTTDDLDNIISKANDYKDIFFNVLIYNSLDSLDSDVKAKVKDMSNVQNIHIYIRVNTNEMNNSYDTVIDYIDDIYNEFDSNIDGILLDNVKVLDDDADEDTKTQWTTYYMGLKNYLHNKVLDNGDILRYYIMTKHPDSSTKYYQVSNYNNPGDTHIAYIGDVPDTYSELGDPFYKQYKHIIIQNEDLSNSSENLINTLYKYSRNIYVNSSDDFSHPDMDNIDKLCQYLSVENDTTTPVQVRKINPN